MDSNNVKTCTIPLKTGKGRTSRDWFLDKVIKTPEDISYLANTYVAPLINGERAFYAVHKAIAQAEHNVDIVCWGFQPSMYFIRNNSSKNDSNNDSNNNDSYNPPIGDLLIEKSLQGVEVSIVCWSMWTDFQDWSEDNMRQGKSDKPSKPIDANSNEITKEQYLYNRWWYAIVRRGCYLYDKTQKNYRKDANNIDITQPVNTGLAAMSTIVPESYILYKEISKAIADTSNQHYKKIYKNLLKLLQTPVTDRRIFFTTRTNKRRWHWFDGRYTFTQQTILFLFPSHHQKTVLIDVHHPEQALGFVMEHNIVDNYWDDDKHKLDKFAPNEGKSVTVPWQDVSMLVTGEVLYDLYLNNVDALEDSVTYLPATVLPTPDWLSLKNKKLQRESFNHDVSARVNEKILPEGCQLSQEIAAQILRTYPRKKETNIKDLYLQNLPQAETYIYTENQYFRWEELVNTIKEARKKMDLDKMGWLYWFVVTNSEEGAVGMATKATLKTMNALGRGDTLPELKRREVKQKKELEQRIIEVQLDDKKRQLVHNQQSIRINEQRMASLKKDIEFSDAAAKPSATKTQMLDQISKVYKVFAKRLTKGIEESAQARSERLQAKSKQIQADNERLQAEGKELQSEIDSLEQQQKENKEQLNTLDKAKVEKNPQMLQESLEEYKMKVHICTLVAPQKYKNRAQNTNREYKLDKNSRWQEVYVHSKVTIVDDTFLTMGSANLNLRSMEHDSEINLAIDGSGKSFIAAKLREALWHNHLMPFPSTNNAEVATENKAKKDKKLLLNADIIACPDTLEDIFNNWEKILDKNQKLEKEHEQPQQALRKFFNSTKHLKNQD